MAKLIRQNRKQTQDMNWNPFRKKDAIEERSVTGQTNGYTLPSEEAIIEMQNSDDPVSKTIGMWFMKAFGTTGDMTLSAVFRAVGLISNSIASLPVYTYKKGKVEAVDHPLHDLLLRAPSPIMNAWQWKKSMIEDMLLKGNAYSLIHRDAENNVTKIEYVPAKNVQVVKEYGREAEIVAVKYKVTGRTRLYESYEMIHVINEPDEEGVEGISTLSFAKKTLDLTGYGETAARAFYESGAKLSGVLQAKGRITSAQKEENAKAWQDTFGPGGNRMGGIAQLGGDLHYEPIQVNAADAQLLESRKFQVEEIARFLHVSPILLYDMEKNSYNSIEYAQLQLLTDTLQPIIAKFEAEFKAKLLLGREYSKMDIKFDTDEFVRTDLKTTVEYYRGLFNLGAITPNEIRERLDMDPIKSSDVEDPADSQFVQAQIVMLKNAENLGKSTQTAIKKQGESDAQDESGE